MQEWAEVLQRLHGQEQHTWSLILTLQTWMEATPFSSAHT